MCELSAQLDILLKKRWRFCDLHFSLAEYRPPCAIYDVEENGRYVGRVTMTLHLFTTPEQAPQTLFADKEDQHSL